MKIYIITDKISREQLSIEVNTKIKSDFDKEEISITLITAIDKIKLGKYLLVAEDDVNDFLAIAKAASLSREFDEVVICDRINTLNEIISKIDIHPLLITLDFKIGDEASIFLDTSKIYNALKSKFKNTEVIGYTNYETPNEDDLGNQAKQLLELLIEKKESVFDKYSINRPEALANIFRDKIRISKFKKENTEIKVENKSLKNTLNYANSNLPISSGKKYIIGNSLPMRLLYNEMQQLKNITPNVLIIGERGTEKELVARSIYEDSPIGQGSVYPYIEVNCAEFSEDNNSIISQLFGHVKGAFTGAISNRKGVFEVADNGTVFLDEIGNLTKTVQEKLLRFLETGRFNKLGNEYKLQPSKVRLICATNKNIDQLKNDGEFRKDFYDRIATVVIKVPPLSERTEDIPYLADFLISNEKILNDNFGNSKIRFTITNDAKVFLSKQNFEGNVRDLKNVLIRSMIKAMASDNKIDITHIIDTMHIIESLPDEAKTVTKSIEDCAAAKLFLDKIHNIVLSKFNSQEKVSQEEVASHFITKTGQYGLKKEVFSTDYFKPHKACIEKLISEKDNVWKETIEKCGFIRNCKSKI